MIPKCKEEKNIYSSDEKVVGKWIDNRLIYRKTITKTVIGSGEKIINLNINNLDCLINVSGIVKYISSKDSKIRIMGITRTSNATTGNQIGWYYSGANNALALEIGDNYSLEELTVYITVEYVKTID